MIAHCRRCAAQCCLRLEVSAEGTVVDAWREKPGARSPLGSVPSSAFLGRRDRNCKNIPVLVGMSADEALAVCARHKMTG